MNKAQLIEELTDRLGDKKAATEAVDNVFDVIVRTVNKGDKVNITGFGVFEKRARAARIARNPRTGESVKVKKTNVPAFRAGSTFKDVISGAKKLPRATAASKSPARATASTRTAATTARSTTTRAAAAKPAATRRAAATTTRAKAAPKTATRTAAKTAPKTTAKAAPKAAAKKTTTAKAAPRAAAKKATPAKRGKK